MVTGPSVIVHFNRTEVIIQNQGGKALKSHLYHGVLAVMGILLLVGACSKSSSPTSPSVPEAKPLTIVVTTETFKATATAPYDTVTSVTGGKWSSGQPGLIDTWPDIHCRARSNGLIN
jgi:hypothetical protein